MNITNKIKSAKSILSYYLFNKKTPLSVVLLITDKCNSRCKYCKIWGRNKKDMTTQQVYSLIDELADMGTQKFSIFGGEPLLRKDIGEIIDYANSKGLFVSMGSNGFLLDKKLGQIKNLGMLNLSFDGPENVHDTHRIKGAHDMVLNAIKIARENNIKVITQTVITKHNLGCLDYILNKAEEMDFLAGFQPAMNRPLSGKKLLSLIPDKGEYKKTINWLIEQKKQGGRIANSKEGLKHLSYVYDWPKFKKKIKCFAPELHVYVDTNGDVYPCLHVQDRIKNPLNCTQIGFKEAYNRLNKLPCYGCWSWSNVEFNLLFSLNPDVVYNTLKLTRY